MNANDPPAERRTRSMVLELTIEMADRLEYTRFLRQKMDGHPVPKKQLVREALDQFLKQIPE